MKKAYEYETAIGRFLIAEDTRGITDITLIHGDDKEALIGKYALIETEQIKEAAAQLRGYLEGSRRNFTIRINPQGTPFQQKVWEALRRIPYGETRSYKQIAEEIGNRRASRAVGMANHHNPIMCVIPCHRVIGAKGSMVGYAAGIETKKQLLGLEQGKEV